jgi:hypothetical protein
MSIGKVDCTIETALCKKYNIKGYPTLKYIRNGSGSAAQDYTSGRDADSIIEFANKLTRPAVSLISTNVWMTVMMVEHIKQQTQQSTNKL